MGRDLCLYPDVFGAATNRSLEQQGGHIEFITRLFIHREPEFLGQLCCYGGLGEIVDDDDGVVGVVQGEKLPEGIEAHLTDHDDEDKCTTDAYGNPLTYIKAGEFAKLDASKICSRWNKAVLAMMLALPPETGVILYWH